MVAILIVLNRKKERKEGRMLFINQEDLAPLRNLKNDLLYIL